MMRMHRASLSILAGLISFLMFDAKAQEWEFIKSEAGVEISKREVVGSDFEEFKSSSKIEGEISAFIALIQDIEGMVDWGYKLKRTELLESSGDTLLIYFSEASAPFPYKNRFGIYLNQFHWDSESQTLFIDIEFLEDYPYESGDLVMLKGKSSWQVKDLGNGKLEVVFQLLVDPGRGIPAWLANMVSDESPLQTMLAIRSEIQKGKYQGKSFDFIKD